MSLSGWRKATCHIPEIALIILVSITAASCAGPRDLLMTATAAITGTEIVISGTANVPDNSLLLCEVLEQGSDTTVAQGTTVVNNCRYTYAASLGDMRSGVVEVRVVFTMQPEESLSQPEAILRLYGSRGEKLKGNQIVNTGGTKSGLVTATVDFVRPVAHQVVKTTDISPLDAERVLIWYVVVEGQPSPRELSALADELIVDAKEKAPFNALSIRFYDYPHYVEQHRAYTVGRVDYAPWGDLGKGLMINAGEYNVMLRSDNLPAKDWSKQLTPAEVEIWEATEIEYSRREDLLTNASAEVDEDSLFRDMARKHGTTIDEVRRIYLKFAGWEASD